MEVSGELSAVPGCRAYLDPAQKEARSIKASFKSCLIQRGGTGE